MKKLITIAVSAIMAIASSAVTFAAEGDAIAAITTTYTFENADQSETTVDQWANPFYNLGLDTATIQYTVQIPDNPKYLTGYDTVMTFGTSAGGFVYVCNELVGINNGNWCDFWPSGENGKMAYPGKGETYTVNLVISKKGVAFYVNGEKQKGSNKPAANANGEEGTGAPEDIINYLNTQSELYIGANNTSYWAPQDMILSDIVFFEGAVTEPYKLTGKESKPGRIGNGGEIVTEEAPSEDAGNAGNSGGSTAQVIVQGGESGSSTMIMIVVIVVVVAAIGVAAVVTLSQKRR